MVGKIMTKENEKYLINGEKAKWECINQKYWIEEYPHLQEILIKR